MHRLSGKKIVVVRTGALGDVLMILPLLQAVHSVQPDCLHVVVEARQKALMEGFDCVDRAFATDDLQWWRVYGDGTDTLPLRFLSDYDCVVALIQDHGGTVADRLCQCLPGEVIVRPPFPHRPDKHVSGYYLETLPELPSPLSWPPGWKAPEEDVREAKRIMASLSPPTRTWILQPGSGGVSKNWPLKRFHEQADWLHSQGILPVFLLGPAEVAISEIVHAFCRERGFPVWESLSLTRCAALLSHADGFLGNDAGVTHLAAALGLPTLAVFVKTEPEMWRPLGANTGVVDIRKTSGADQDGAGEVRRELDRLHSLRARN
ncbi:MULTISPECIES: glycosyltransferase family 9 protein [unclassified Nitrospina]|uniref:glycosyltransferase family 9 protein n=1 Tax=unclassified Nitrospina TaxID=2638683 RepID=UPI003F962253